jgi:hypothetical protein
VIAVELGADASVDEVDNGVCITEVLRTTTVGSDVRAGCGVLQIDTWLAADIDGCLRAKAVKIALGHIKDMNVGSFHVGYKELAMGTRILCHNSGEKEGCSENELHG